MITIFKTALELQSFCEKQGWRSCFIGGIAAQAWSQPRVTLDVDLTLLTGFGDEASFIDTLLTHYSPRNPNAAHQARSSDARGLEIRPVRPSGAYADSIAGHYTR